MVAAALLFLSFLPFSLGVPNPSTAISALERRHNVISRHHFALPPFSNMLIALSPANITGLLGSLSDVSNPASTNYGRHLSKADVCAQSCL